MYQAADERRVDGRRPLAYVRPMTNASSDPAPRTVRLFRNGRSQAVRIPREFELPGKDAVMRRENGRLVIEPAPPNSLLELLATLEPLEEEFPEIDDPPPEPFEL